MLDSNMVEQDCDDLPAKDFEQAKQLDDDFIQDDAQPLCLKCLKPSHPLQHYCDNCDSNAVINPLTPYIPFLNIRFNYGGFCTMWRKIWYDKDTLIIPSLFYLFMIIMFAPIMLIVGFPLVLIGKIKNTQLQKTATVAFWVLVVLLLIAYLIYTGVFQ